MHNLTKNEMLNIIQTINRIGGGNFEDSELTHTRNVLTEGRLSLFIGAMMAALFVFISMMGMGGGGTINTTFRLWTC